MKIPSERSERGKRKILCIHFYAEEFERMSALSSHYGLTMAATVRMLLKRDSLDTDIASRISMEEIASEKKENSSTQFRQQYHLGLTPIEYQKVAEYSKVLCVKKADVIRWLLKKEEKKILSSDE